MLGFRIYVMVGLRIYVMVGSRIVTGLNFQQVSRRGLRWVQSSIVM